MKTNFSFLIAMALFAVSAEANTPVNDRSFSTINIQSGNLYSPVPLVYAGEDTSVCGDTYTLLASELEASETGTWTAIPELSPAAFSDIHSPNATVVIPAYSDSIVYQFIWTVDDGTGTSDDDVIVTFFEIPSPYVGVDTTICGSEYHLNATGVIGEGFWTVTDGLGDPVYDVLFFDPVDPDNPHPETEPVVIANTALLGPEVFLSFTWNETNGVCSDTDEVSAYFVAGPYSYAGNDIITCGNSANMNADITGVELLNYFWTCQENVVFYDHNTLAPIDPATDPDAIVTLVDEGLFINGVAEVMFLWNVECSPGSVSSDAVNITFYQQTEANAGIDSFSCNNTYIMQAEKTYSSSLGHWTFISGPSTPVFSSTEYSTPEHDPHATVMVSATGDYQFQWTESNPSFSSCFDTDMVNIHFINLPYSIDVGNDTVYCQNGDGQYIAELHATGGTGVGVWMSTYNLTGYGYSNQLSPNTTVISNHPVIETFCWRETIESGYSQPCILEDCITISFSPRPNVSLLTENDWVCGPEYININGSVFDADTAYWFDATHAGTDFINNSVSGLTDPLNVHDTIHVSIYGQHQMYLIAENHVTFNENLYVCADSAGPLFLTFYEWPEPYVNPTDTSCGNCYDLVGEQSMDSTVVTWSSLSPSGLTFSSTGSAVGTSINDEVCVTIIDTTRIIYLTEYYPYDNRCAVQSTIAIRFAGVPYGLFEFEAPECFGGTWMVSTPYDSFPSYQWNFGDIGDYEIGYTATNTAGGTYLDSINWTNEETYHVVELVTTNSYGCSSVPYQDTLYEPAANYAEILSVFNPCLEMDNGWVNLAGAGGTSPLSPHQIQWLSSTGIVNAYEDSINVSGLPVGDYPVLITDINNCSLTDTVSIIEDSQIEITGVIEHSSIPFNSGEVEIELYNDDLESIFVESKTNGESGYFQFNPTSSGNFFLKASVINEAAYPNMVPTYYDQQYLCADVDYLNLGCHDEVNVVFTMIEELPLTTGLGFISGYAFYDTMTKDTTDPVSGMSVFLVSQVNENDIFNYSTTNDTGYYYFQEIPTGEYSIMADIPGLPLISYHDFEVSETSLLFENYNFLVDTSGSAKGYGIYAVGGTGIENSEPLSIIKVFPNPVTDRLIIEFDTEKPVPATISILDINGKKLYQMVQKNVQHESRMIIDEIDYSPGTYFLTIQIENQMIIKKFIKN
ncbi:MAG: hypothetical protein A2W91_02800 [Bacteroidetes bacterium GWF2_38_335]|nr:MAG: hypothetical protein A2W91_02800 [Bacteroidetes bacterium GWF2_38_335]OFY77577.1 MAG: hypothetical protein A2281_01960 [Bacteroidetes bacterium RIFOXYA12_FULL_38_20]HBS87122.1 hypothetical protein [Bacteroidales bacterium]